MSITRAITAVCCALLASACDALGEDGDDLADALADREFLSERVEGHELVPDTQIRMRFGEELSAYAGCNHFSGHYRIAGHVLTLTDLSGTEIGCEPALSAQDAWLTELLQASPALALDEPRLTLRSGDVVVTMLDRTIASPDRPLVGTHWVGNGQGDGSAVSFGPGSDATTVTFGSDGTAEIFTACQHGTAEFTADEDTITFAGLGYDGAACSTPQFASVSAAVLFVLDGSPLRYEIREKNLTLSRAGRMLLYRADE